MGVIIWLNLGICTEHTVYIKIRLSNIRIASTLEYKSSYDPLIEFANKYLDYNIDSDELFNHNDNKDEKKY